MPKVSMNMDREREIYKLTIEDIFMVIEDSDLTVFQAKVMLGELVYYCSPANFLLGSSDD